MALIEFKDYPNTSTPLNAENLNNNFNCLNGTLLYDNADGTQETVTINESANNFKYIEIFFKNAENVYNSVKVYQPNNKIVSCSSPLASNGSETKTYLRSTDYTISETSITPRRKLYMEIEGTAITTFIANTNYILITRVVGYR